MKSGFFTETGVTDGFRVTGKNATVHIEGGSGTASVQILVNGAWGVHRNGTAASTLAFSDGRIDVAVREGDFIRLSVAVFSGTVNWYISGVA